MLPRLRPLRVDPFLLAYALVALIISGWVVLEIGIGPTTPSLSELANSR